MKSLTKFYLIAFCLSLLLADCNKLDDHVFITYQHLGNFPSWTLPGGGSKLPNQMWHVYMLRGIVNKGKDAQDFLFDSKKLATKNGASVSFTDVMLKADPLTIPPYFNVLVKRQLPKQGPYTVPLGTGVLFFIQENDDPEPTTVTPLVYRTAGADGNPKIQVGVTMQMLDTKPPMFGHLDQAFLEQIHDKQNKYEHDYDAEGNKK
jgi:hypothetical protein